MAGRINDALVGGDGADQLDGGGGTNTLRGGLGDDIYVYGADGGISIVDNSDGGTDWLIFTDDITSDRLAYLRDGDDLIVRVDGDENAQVTISTWFLGEEYQLSYIQPANANGISAWTINRMFPPEKPEADGITTPDSNSFDMLWYGTSSAEQLIGTDGADLIRSYQGEDSLFGLDGDDWLLGGSDADYLDGGSGNDLLFGGDGNDQLGGGSGDDILIGGAGDDIYVYGAGSGADSIDNSGGGTDWLIFTDGITSARLTYLQDGDDLIVRVDNDETTQVTIRNWFLDSAYTIDYIQPDGEYGISAAQIETLLAAGSSNFDTVVDGTDSAEQLVGTSGSDQLNAYAGDDQLFGLSGDDELNGGDGADYLDGGAGDDIQSGGTGDDQLGGDAGNDTLIGGTGNDVYVYTSGSGADTIDNSDGGTDWLIFTDITGERLAYLQDGDDLIIRVDEDAATQVTITNWFAGLDYQLAYIQPSGESAISAATITALFDTGEEEEEGDSEIPDASAFDNVTTGTDSAEQLVGTNGMNLLQGLAGDDQLFGLSGDDWLVAGDGADYLDGGAGNDVQLGGAGSDQLGGDAGDDLLIGGADDDIYVYRAGSGADTIDNSGGGTDWLIFTDDITANRLSYHRSGDDLLVKIDGDETTMVTVKHWFDGGDYKLSYIQPSGGYGISATTIESLLSTTPDSGFDTLVTGTDSADTLTGASTADQLRGDDGDDQLSGLDGDDELSGDDGNDLLYGGAGNDTYLFNLGDGSDSLYDASGTDSILFGDEVTADGFALFMNGDTLRIGYGTDDVITLADYSDSSTGNRIEALTLADGSYLSDSDITQIIQDISAYATAEGIAMTCLDDVRQNDELMTIISSTWDVFA
ncbi:MAG: calcium-binding protein [Desulfuromonas thiophila]|nr:calcium-binding protein [Desulfuromonas thiophila]